MVAARSPIRNESYRLSRSKSVSIKLQLLENFILSLSELRPTSSSMSAEHADKPELRQKTYKATCQRLSAKHYNSSRQQKKTFTLYCPLKSHVEHYSYAHSLLHMSSPGVSPTPTSNRGTLCFKLSRTFSRASHIPDAGAELMFPNIAVGMKGTLGIVDPLPRGSHVSKRRTITQQGNTAFC